MRIGLLVLLLCLVPVTPQGGNAPLGDFGTISYTDTQPNVARITSTIEFVFSLFPTVDIPPTTIEFLPLGKYEERVAQMEGGPNWRMWLSSYRSQTQWTISATTDRRAAYEGRLQIMTFTDLPDMILIHECLHYIAMQLEPGSFEARDHAILNTEATVQAMTAAILVSKRYRAYLRERPWVK